MDRVFETVGAVGDEHADEKGEGQILEEEKRTLMGFEGSYC
jgi:hypothetical protein